MKTAILTVGPQGAGKSTYCEKTMAAHPDIFYVSRDKILTELYGSAWLDPYSGAHQHGMEQVWETIAKVCQQGNDQGVMIVDVWNQDHLDRLRIVHKLRELYFEIVKAWYFVTPLEISMRWFYGRENVSENKNSKWAALANDLRRCSYTRCFRGYHHDAEDVRNGKLFDSVVFINPLQRYLFPDFVPV